MALQVKGSSSKKKVRVLLLGGVTKPRDSSAKRRRSRAAGAYLEGVSHDLANVESFLRRSPTFELENKFHDMRYGTTADVKKQIERMLRNNPDPDRPLAIYYSGHGSSNGGALCFRDANFGWKDLAGLIQKRGNIKIFLDSCFSGDWAVKLMSLKGKTKNVEIFAGSHPGASAIDDGKNGGLATGKWLTLWPKLFDEFHNVRFGGMAVRPYGCLGKIHNDGCYSFTRYRDAEAEYLLDMKGAANEDDSKQEHASVTRTCRGRHGLQHFVSVGRHTCDECGTTPPKGTGNVYGCRKCDYDLCGACYWRGVHTRCPKRHFLQNFATPRNTFRCNGCDQRVVKGTVMFGCRKCNYDLCTACFEAI